MRMEKEDWLLSIEKLEGGKNIKASVLVYVVY